jgi:hypothetical protein
VDFTIRDFYSRSAIRISRSRSAGHKRRIINLISAVIQRLNLTKADALFRLASLPSNLSIAAEFTGVPGDAGSLLTNTVQRQVA